MARKRTVDLLDTLRGNWSQPLVSTATPVKFTGRPLGFRPDDTLLEDLQKSVQALNELRKEMGVEPLAEPKVVSHTDHPDTDVLVDCPACWKRIQEVWE